MTDTLNISGLRFGWPGHPSLLDIPQLSIAAGESLFLYGPSGCGKSTLLNLISGVLEVTSGKIDVAGFSFDQLSSAQRDLIRADHIGVLFQQFNLLNYLSVLDNVMLPCHFSAVRRKRVKAQYGSVEAGAQALLAQLGLSKELLARDVTALSIGQQQRVAAARALLGSPSLLIADEPTSALDESNRDQFLDLLMEQCQQHQMSLLFVSHDMRLKSHFMHSQDLRELNHIQTAAAD